MALRINKYLFDLRSNANRWERIDINGVEDDSFVSKYFKKVVLISISIFFVFILKSGFNSNFVAYSSTVLSILIGLFITAIIFSFDKFYPTDKNENKFYEVGIKRKDTEQPERIFQVSLENISVQNSKEKLSDTQAFNYSKQFAYITGYNIVLCVFAVVALSFSALFEKQMIVNLREYEFNFHQINYSSVLLFLKLSFVALQRYFVVYWMLSVMYNTLFIVSSIVKFMTVKIDRNND